MLKRVGIGGRLNTNFRFADEIVVNRVNAEEEEEAHVLADRLDSTITGFEMKTGPDKTKVVQKTTQTGIQSEIRIKGQRVETVENFRYLGLCTAHTIAARPKII